MYLQVPLGAAAIDQRIVHRISNPPLFFFDGTTFAGVCLLNKVVRTALAEETEVYTTGTARFIHGGGVHAANIMPS